MQGTCLHPAILRPHSGCSPGPGTEMPLTMREVITARLRPGCTACAQTPLVPACDGPQTASCHLVFYLGRHDHCPVTDAETEAPTCLAMLGLELPSGLFRIKMKAPGRTPHPRPREVKGRQERLFHTEWAQQMSRNQRPVQALPCPALEGSPRFCGSPASKSPHCCSPEAAEPAPCPSCP